MSQVITALVAKVAMDTKDVTAGSAQVRKDAATVSRVFRDMETDTDKLEKKVRSLHEQYKRGAIDAEKYQKALKHLDERYVEGPAKAKAAAEAEKQASDQRKAALDSQRKAEQAAAVEAKRLSDARQQALPIIERSRTAAERYAATLRQLNRAHRMGAISTEEHQRGLQQLRAEMRQSHAATQKGSGFVNGLGGAFSFLSPQVLAASAAMGVFYGSARLIQNSIKLAAELEEIGVRFEVLTGNAEDAEALVSSMRKLANTTSLTFSGLRNNAQTMLAFGVATEQVIPALKQIGDITSGDAERMKSLSLAYAQMASAGKLMGQDLLQMVNAGFNPLQEISEKTGVSITELRKQMENGAISADLVALAFESATAEGGRFENMLEKSKETFSGQMRQLNSDIEVIITAIGEELLPVVKDLASTFGGLASERNVKFIRELTALTTAAGQFSIDPFNAVFGLLERYGLVDAPFDGVGDELKEAEEKGSALADKMSDMLASGETDAFKEMSDEFERQIELLELGEKAFARREMYAKGFTAEQIKQIEAQQEYIAEQERLIDQEEKDSAKKIKDAEELKKKIDDMRKQGQDMMDKNNPVMMVAKQLADLDVLLNANAIDQATYFKERNKILKESVANEGRSQSASAIEVGSSAAVDFRNEQINNQIDQQYEEQKKQTIIQQSQLTALNLANQKLAELGITRRITP